MDFQHLIRSFIERVTRLFRDEDRVSMDEWIKIYVEGSAQICKYLREQNSTNFRRTHWRIENRTICRYNGGKWGRKYQYNDPDFYLPLVKSGYIFEIKIITKGQIPPGVAAVFGILTSAAPVSAAAPCNKKHCDDCPKNCKECDKKHCDECKCPECPSVGQACNRKHCDDATNQELKCTKQHCEDAGCTKPCTKQHCEDAGCTKPCTRPHCDDAGCTKPCNQVKIKLSPSLQTWVTFLKGEADKTAAAPKFLQVIENENEWKGLTETKFDDDVTIDKWNVFIADKQNEDMSKVVADFDLKSLKPLQRADAVIKYELVDDWKKLVEGITQLDQLKRCQQLCAQWTSIYAALKDMPARYSTVELLQKYFGCSPAEAQTLFGKVYSNHQLQFVTTSWPEVVADKAWTDPFEIIAEATVRGVQMPVTDNTQGITVFDDWKRVAPQANSRESLIKCQDEVRKFGEKKAFAKDFGPEASFANWRKFLQRDSTPHKPSDAIKAEFFSHFDLDSTLLSSWKSLIDNFMFQEPVKPWDEFLGQKQQFPTQENDLSNWWDEYICIYSIQNEPANNISGEIQQQPSSVELQVAWTELIGAAKPANLSDAKKIRQKIQDNKKNCDMLKIRWTSHVSSCNTTELDCLKTFFEQDENKPLDHQLYRTELTKMKFFIGNYEEAWSQWVGKADPSYINQWHELFEREKGLGTFKWNWDRPIEPLVVWKSLPTKFAYPLDQYTLNLFSDEITAPKNAKKAWHQYLWRRRLTLDAAAPLDLTELKSSFDASYGSYQLRSDHTPLEELPLDFENQWATFLSEKAHAEMNEKDIFELIAEFDARFKTQPERKPVTLVNPVQIGFDVYMVQAKPMTVSDIIEAFRKYTEYERQQSVCRSEDTNKELLQADADYIWGSFKERQNQLKINVMQAMVTFKNTHCIDKVNNGSKPCDTYASDWDNDAKGKVVKLDDVEKRLKTFRAQYTAQCTRNDAAPANPTVAGTSLEPYFGNPPLSDDAFTLLLPMFKLCF